MSGQNVTVKTELRLISLDAGEDTVIEASYMLSPLMTDQGGMTLFEPCLAMSGNEVSTLVADQTPDVINVYRFAVLAGEGNSVLAQVSIGQHYSARQAACLHFDLIADEAEFLIKAGDVINRVLRFVFVDLGLHRVCVILPAYDESMIQVYEEAGFLRETQRRQAVCHDGRYYDELIYGMLSTEWQLMHEEVSNENQDD